MPWSQPWSLLNDAKERQLPHHTPLTWTVGFPWVPTPNWWWSYLPSKQEIWCPWGGGSSLGNLKYIVAWERVGGGEVVLTQRSLSAQIKPSWTILPLPCPGSSPHANSGTHLEIKKMSQSSSTVFKTILKLQLHSLGNSPLDWTNTLHHSRKDLC